MQEKGSKIQKNLKSPSPKPFYQNYCRDTHSFSGAIKTILPVIQPADIASLDTILDCQKQVRKRLYCFVYILGSFGSQGNRTYVGWTTDLERRLSQHNAGTGARTTRGRRWSLLYAERYTVRNEAMSREWHLKRERQFRRRLLEAGNPDRHIFHPD